MQIILIDFGATRIKSILFCTQTGQILNTAEAISPSTKNHTEEPGFVIPLSNYRKVFEELIYQLDPMGEVDQVYTCFEMHGFSLDEHYYSWKDGRANLDLAKEFYNETGMKLRSGIAFSTLQYLNISGKKIGTLANAILDYVQGNHISLLSSLGFVNYKTSDISQYILDKTKCETYPLTDNYLGYSSINNKHYNVYGGLGDLQAALLGAGLGINADIVINLGTGSQVATRLTDSYNELRPMSTTEWVNVITHIPSGRALNAIAEIVDANRFWNIWAELSLDDVVQENIHQIDLNIFPGSWKYKSVTDSGYIRIKESQSIKEFVAAVAASWLNQYVDALESIDKNKQFKKVILSGGLSNKSNFALDYFKYRDPIRAYSKIKTITGEETLDGLLRFAGYYDNEN